MSEAEEVAEGVVRSVVKDKQSCFSYGCDNVDKDAFFAFNQIARVFIRHLSTRALELSKSSNRTQLNAIDVSKAVEDMDFSHLSDLLKSSFDHVIGKNKSFPPLFPPHSGDDDDSDVEDVAHNNLLITAYNEDIEFAEEDDKHFENWERIVALHDDPERVAGRIRVHELPCDNCYDDCHVCKKARAAARYAVKRFNEHAFTVLKPTKIVRLVYVADCGDPYLFYMTLETDDKHLFEVKVDTKYTGPPFEENFRCKLFRPAQCFKSQDVDSKFLLV
ncbi:Histone-fold containing protein [Trema orientale]|uniref:Histone-fold containing protein n=1 Tax=Trema orientale TaxID=63057 RepID=A0A2P5F5W7_TREOI|nr:Histone-fold containing protein [Trema orientale]